MKNIVLSIDGMTCSACSNGLEKYLNKQNGIINASVNLIMANAVIDYDDNILDLEKIEKYIRQAGFSSLGEFKKFEPEKKNKLEIIKLIIYSILILILMYISMGHMIGLPVISLFSPHNSPINYVIILLVLSILFLIYGYDILKNGYKSLIHGIPNMDTLVTIGVFSSFCYSLYQMWTILKGNYMNVENLYFESSATIIFFIKLGRYLESISKDRTKDAIAKLVEITPSKAIIEVDANEKEVTLDEIKKGDILICKPGEKIAVDGLIIEGEAHFDEAFITGESKPIMKNKGQNVIAGSFNYDGFIKYKAVKIGKDSTVSEVVRLVIEASNTKAPMAKIADKISGYFVPIVMIIAFLTFIGYLLLGFELSTAVGVFITILVVTCPCSLGLATPLAIVVSEGICVSNGLLVRKSEILENASKIDTIVFDKTGTLTYGKLKISSIQNYSDLDDKKLLQLVGSLEAKSDHPIARTFTTYMNENNLEKLPVRDFKDLQGMGIVGKINGKRVILGNSKIVERFDIKNTYLDDEKALAIKGNTIVYVIENDKIIALIGIGDIIRGDALEVIEKLNKRRIKTIMLTGDNKEVAEKVGKELKISKVIADLLPIEKSEMIRKLKADGLRVMMCGDGINDSPALATADIGVSVKSGTDIAINSSGVILTNNDLKSILKLIEISEKTAKNIKQNLFWAFFYNSLMIPIAMGLFRTIGISINPTIASIAMIFSSLTVILNALRLRWFKSN